MSVATQEDIERLIDNASHAWCNKKPDKAFEILFMAQERCMASDNRRTLITVLLRLSDLHHEMGDFDVALNESKRAVTLARALLEPGPLADALRHLGDMNKDLLHADEAIRCYDEAIRLLEQHPENHDQLLADTLRPLAMLRERLHQRDAALDCWTRAGRLYQQLHIDTAAAECDRHIRRLQ